METIAKPTSCGVLVQCGDRYLIVKSSGGTVWGVPKGLQDSTEGWVSCALRELFEETNILLEQKDLSSEVFSYETKQKRIVIFRAIVDEERVKNFKLNCASLLETGIPEVDDFKWATLDEARGLVKNHMARIFRDFVK